MAVGYMRLWREEVSPEPFIDEGVAQLQSYCDVRDWALGEIFIDDEPESVGRHLAWSQVVVVVREFHPVAVIVPDLPQLCPTLSVMEAMAARLASQSSARLLVAGALPWQVPH